MATHILSLYGSICTEKDIQSMCQAAREEDLYLEFKQKCDRRNSELHDSDRKNFSKAVSGFANADGGILILGVETQRTPNGVDCAAALKPITYHTRLRARLLDSIFSTTQPVVDGIDIDTIDSQNGGGYVKCLIPQSVRAPHRAVSAEHQYWRRTATGHRRMDHYELEDLFGRRLRPSLTFFVELKPREGDDPHEELHFLVLNDGRGLARHVGFFVQPTDAKIEGVRGHGLANATAMNSSTTVTYYDPHHVVHATGIYLSAGHAILRRDTKGSPLHVSATWYAEDAETKRASGTVVPGARLKPG